jgi:agmatine deiminase
VQRPRGDRREQAIVDWGYNAWGGKYPPFDLDDVVPTRIGAELGLPVFEPGIVMEGGSIDVNGRGTLLTTEACLLNPNRNPQLDRAAIERYLRDYLGVVKILWLGDGIVGDDTDGHVDDLTRFVDEQTVVTVVEEDPADENYEPLGGLDRPRECGIRMAGPSGGEPAYAPAMHHDGQRLPPATPIYIANDMVLLPPTIPLRGRARVLQQHFRPAASSRWIRATGVGLGSFHCPAMAGGVAAALPSQGHVVTPPAFIENWCQRTEEVPVFSEHGPAPVPRCSTCRMATAPPPPAGRRSC